MDQNRWTLMFHGSTQTYVLTEQWLVEGRWEPRTRSSWRTLPEVIRHIAETNEQRKEA